MTAAWRAELAPETSLSVRMDDRLEVVQQRQVDFVDGHAAIPPRASLETEIQRHCGTVNAPAVLERHRYALPSASDELTYTTSSTTKAWALGEGNATLAYPDCGWAASTTEAVTYVDVSFDAPLQLRQGISAVSRSTAATRPRASSCSCARTAGTVFLERSVVHALYDLYASSAAACSRGST